MAIYLGTTLISSNPTGTGALYLGESNICDAYLENTQVFDNCTAANTSVVLTVDESGIVGSTSDGVGPYTIVGDLTGYTKTGQPGTTFTAFNTSVSIGANNAWQAGSPTFSGEVGGTFPATGSITRTTIVAGTTVYTPPNPTGTYSFSESGSAGSGVTFSVSPNKNSQTGVINSSTYSWEITAALANGYTATSGITINGTTVIASGTAGPTTGAFTLTGDINQASDTINATYGGSSAVPTYTYSFSLTNPISNTTTSQSVSNLSSGASASGPSGGTITITGPEGSTWNMNGSATPSSGYEWSGGSRPSSADQTVSGTMPSNSSGTTTITLSGSVNQTTNTVEIFGSFYSKVNACAATGSTSTKYFIGGSEGDPGAGTRLYSNSSLTGEISTGWYYNEDIGEPFYYSGGISSIESC